MADPKSANDPSMDDILASIRKIISDDEARAQVTSQQAAAQSGGRPAVTPPIEPKLHGAGRDDVLLLTDLIEDPKSDSVPTPAAPDPGPTVGTGGKTVEELVKETLRPMLKEWLDQNLPQLVERYVEREIVRLTRR